MKKFFTNYILIYLAIAAVLVTIALVTGHALEDVLTGLGSGAIGAALGLLLIYLYWRSPGKQAEYQRRVAEKHISLKDERKIMLRDKSGRIVYCLMLVIYFAAAMVSAVCMIFSEQQIFTYITIVLYVLLIFQYVCGIVVFRYLDKRL